MNKMDYVSDVILHAVANVKELLIKGDGVLML